MKKILSTLILASLLVVPIMVFAQNGIPPAPEGAPELITTGAGLVEAIETIGDWIFTIVLVIASLFLLIAGFMFVTAGGNPEQTLKARQMLINALIGVAIALLAKGLVLLVQSVLGA